jgi:transcriptional regulator with PAS, ATPase and Fis domain
MVSISCAAVPEHLLEAELFGHVKGAFTGAVHQRAGRFEQAHGSTLFLDEIGDMPLSLQGKLLRVLQEREFQRLGSSETRRVDVRIIAATNVKLAEKIRKGEFRQDLYYRLAVAIVCIPPLRERTEDIPALLDHFLTKVCVTERVPQRSATAECVQALRCHGWPGNVREMEHAVEAAVALSGSRQVLCRRDFPGLGVQGPPPLPEAELQLPPQGLDFEDAVGRFERSILRQALNRSGGNKTQAAGLLGLKRTTLAAKLRSLGESCPEAEAMLVN